MKKIQVISELLILEDFKVVEINYSNNIVGGGGTNTSDSDTVGTEGR